MQQRRALLLQLIRYADKCGSEVCTKGKSMYTKRFFHVLLSVLVFIGGWAYFSHRSSFNTTEVSANKEAHESDTHKANQPDINLSDKIASQSGAQVKTMEVDKASASHDSKEVQQRSVLAYSNWVKGNRDSSKLTTDEIRSAIGGAYSAVIQPNKKNSVALQYTLDWRALVQELLNRDRNDELALDMLLKLSLLDIEQGRISKDLIERIQEARRREPENRVYLNFYLYAITFAEMNNFRSLRKFVVDYPGDFEANFLLGMFSIANAGDRLSFFKSLSKKYPNENRYDDLISELKDGRAFRVFEYINFDTDRTHKFYGQYVDN